MAQYEGLGARLRYGNETDLFSSTAKMANSSAPEGFQFSSNSPAASRLAGRVDSAEGRAEADRNIAEAPASNRQLYTSTSIKTLAFNVFEELRRQKQLCDVVIHVGNTEFHAHRVILAAACPYFRSMFTGALIAGSARTSREVQVHVG